MKRYLCKGVPGFDGFEFLSDPPVGRRLYREGEIVELRPDQARKALERGWVEQIVEEKPPEKKGEEPLEEDDNGI